jgi:RNA polymerase sigma-70 factor (ECF subfamily)
MLTALTLHVPAARPFVHSHEGRAAFQERMRATEALVSSDDAALITQVGKGDAGAYRALVERYLTGIVRYATRMLASQAEGEDVAQETFLRLWRDAARYEARGHAASTWLYRVAHNLCIDRLRKRKPERPESEEPVSNDRTSAPQADKELAAHVAHALSELPERQRAAIALVHYEDKSLEETGEVLGCAASAVESLLSRGRRSLREKLSAYYRGSEEP